VLDWLWINVVELSLIVALIAAVGLLVVRARSAKALATESDAARRSLEQRMEAIESAGDAFLLTGSGDRCLYTNVAGAELFGYDQPRELFGKSWRSFIAESDARRMDSVVGPALKESGRWVGTMRGRTKRGEAVPLDVSASSVRGGFLFVLRNRRAAADEGDGDPIRFESLVNSSSNTLVLLSEHFEILEWNPEAERQLGRSRDRVLRTSFLELFDIEVRERVAEQLHAVLSTGERRSFEAVPRLEEGQAPQHGRAFLWTVSHVASDRGALLSCVGQDVTRLRHTEQEVSRQENLYRMLANNSSDLVGVHDLEGTFTYVSPSCTTLIGYTEDELVGKDPYQLSHTDDWKGIQGAFAAARTGRHTRTSLRIRTSSGHYTWFEMSVRPLYDNLGTIIQIQTSSRDISEQKAVEQQLSHQALHEPLTGLPNRSLFLDRLKHAMTLAKRSGGQIAVAFMDLDRFKIINDSMGHEAGDRLIQATARRLAQVLRDGDTVARLGGDEFGVLLEYGITQPEAEKVAQRILTAVEPPFTFSGQEMYVSASVGMAFSSPEVDDPEDLLRYADVAMYRAKSEGPGKFRVFDPEIDSGATGRLAMETDLRQAIDREQVFNAYQPIVSLASGRITAFEALVRWRHPQRGLVGPDEFIPVAEETGLIVPLGYLVTRRACEALQAFQRVIGPKRDLVVAVNLSTRQFEQPDLEHEIMRILEETRTRPEQLRIEITESELMRDTGRIRELRSKGLQVAIDDFGTGYSSLAYLRNIEADSLKIDRMFVDGLGQHAQDEAIVRTVVTLARELGMDVTAEGIETEEQMELLRQIGVDSGQGFFLARPAPADEVLELLREDPAWLVATA